MIKVLIPLLFFWYGHGSVYANLYPHKCLAILEELRNSQLKSAPIKAVPIQQDPFYTTLQSRNLKWIEAESAPLDFYIQDVGYLKGIRYRLAESGQKKLDTLLKTNPKPANLQALLESEFYSKIQKQIPRFDLTQMDLIIRLARSSSGEKIKKVLESFSFSDLFSLYVLSLQVQKYSRTEKGLANGFDTMMQVMLRDPSFSMHDLYIERQLEFFLFNFMDPKKIQAEVGNLEFIKEARAIFQNDHEFDIFVERFVLQTHARVYQVEKAAQEALIKEYGSFNNIPSEIRGTNDPHGLQTKFSALLDIFSVLNLPPDSQMVDLGSGFGRIGNFVGLTRPDIQFLGYELIKERVDLAQETAQRFDFNRVGYQQQDLSDPQFTPKAADIYYMFDPTTKEVRQKIFKDLEQVHEKQSFRLIVSSGWSNNILAELRKLPWLKEGVSIDHGQHYKMIVFETTP